MRFRLLLAIVMAVSLTPAACSSSAEISEATTTADEPTQTATTEAATETVADEVATETTTVSSTDLETDAAGATSCEELDDVDFAIFQEFINVFGAGPFEDWYTNSPSVSPEMQDGFDVWMEKAEKSTEQAASLGCDEGAEVERDKCARMSQLDPLGDAGLGFLHDMVPCDLDPEDQARVNEFLAIPDSLATTSQP
jgi:hypothetical protein